MTIYSVVVTDPKTGEETEYPTVYAAAKAIGTTGNHVRVSIKRGSRCRGFLVRYGEVTEKRPASQPNICFDCKKACGKCSWSGLDPETHKPAFEPVPGWTAEKVLFNSGYTISETYHITACPLFEPDEPRSSNNCELTYTESCDFLKNANYLLKRWEDG